MVRKSLLPLIGWLALALPASATHISGGEIYYDCLGGNQYRITLVVYRDCAGIALDNSYILSVQSPCGNKTVTVSTPGGTEISQLCNLQLPNSTCSGGTLPGIQQYIYTGTVNLPPCNSWTVSWTEQWRNGAIANLVNPGNKNVYIEAKLNNSLAPCDDSPQFTNTAIPYVCAGYPISYSYGTFDPEGDSLTYTFIDAMNIGAVNLPYVSPHSGTEPIPGITLDAHSGQVNFTLNQVGNWVVVVRVDQYDADGNWTGSVMRDMQFIAYPCTNMPPDPASGTVADLTGQATQTGPRSIEICESGNFCFDAVITDPDAGDVLTVTSNIAQNLPGATLTTTGTNPLTVHVCWTGMAGTSGFFPFIITANDGACPIPALQTYVYSVNVLPGLLLAAPDIVDESCAGNEDGSATVNISVGTPPYQFLWNTGATDSWVVGPAGDYTVVITDGNGCVAGPVDITIGVGNQPSTALAGPDLVGCPGSLPVVLNGSVVNAQGGTWGGGSGTITGTGVNATYMPSADELAQGGVDLFLTTTGDSPCGPASDTVHISFPNSFAGGQVAAADLDCKGDTDGAASFTPALPGFTFQWNDAGAQTTPTANGLAAGTYSVLVSDSLGCDTTLSVTIHEPDALVITALDVTDEGCAGDGSGSITATVTGGTPPYQYSWSNGETGPVMHGGAGTYTLTVSDAKNCTPVQATATISAQGQPNAANAGPDQVACFTDLPVQLTGSVTNATGGTWGGGTGSFSGTGLSVSYLPSEEEIQANGIDLVLTTTGNTGCPPAADTVHITLSISFFGSTVSTSPLACNGDGSGSASFEPADPGFSFHWNDPAGQTSATASGLAAGTYSVLVSDSLGCDTTAQVIITEPDSLVIAGITATDASCAGESDGTASVTVTGGTPVYTYAWDASTGGQTTPTASGLSAGSYAVTVTDANGCQAQASIGLQAPLPITLNAFADDTVCVNAPVLLTATAAGGTGELTINWAGIGSGDSVLHAFPAAQLVHVSVTDQAGCAGPALDLPITVLDLSLATLHTYGDTAFCPGGTATVGAWLSGYPSPLGIAWSQPALIGNGPFQLTTDTSLSLIASATDVCGNSLEASIPIMVETPPAITLAPVIAEGCAPLTVHFPTGLTDQPVSYFWQFGDGSTSTSMMPVHVYPAGSYTASLTVTTPLGCTSGTAATGMVHAWAPPVAAFTANPWETNMDQPEVQFTDQSQGDITSWDWGFGDGASSQSPDPVHEFTGPGQWNVSLTVTDGHGCSDQAENMVTVTPVYDITIPNVFTPNPNGSNGGSYDPNDLSNDVFYPFIRFVKDFNMRIFNRWGELVFESDDIRVGWDGYYRGHISPQDVYVYQLRVRFTDNKEMQRTGDLTLLR